MIQRPDLEYNDKRHEYKLKGVRLNGVSTISKIGDLDVWGVAAAWAFRIGYEGAYDALAPYLNDDAAPITSADELREVLKQARRTPWHKTDDSKDRGNAIHKALEVLAQNNEVPVLKDFPAQYHGYIQAICKWYLEYRPRFEAVEVQVVSEQHMFAGRYDLRCTIPTLNGAAEELLLVDLKTGKRIYPTTQFAQLAGYELAGVEMGYAPTDAQYILNVHEDGTYDFEPSVATAEHFLAYLAAQRAILDIKEKAKKGSK